MLIPPLHRRPHAAAPLRASALPAQASRPLGLGRNLLGTPFDALRFQYAGAVRLGLAPRSIVASGQLEQALGRLETLILGPLARRR